MSAYPALARPPQAYHPSLVDVFLSSATPWQVSRRLVVEIRSSAREEGPQSPILRGARADYVQACPGVGHAFGRTHEKPLHIVGALWRRRRDRATGWGRVSTSGMPSLRTRRDFVRGALGILSWQAVRPAIFVSPSAMLGCMGGLCIPRFEPGPICYPERKCARTAARRARLRKGSEWKPTSRSSLSSWSSPTS